MTTLGFLILLAVIVTVAVVGVSWWAHTAMRKYDVDQPGVLPSGEAVARELIRRHGLIDITIEDGDVDCYRARQETIVFADGRRERASITAVAVAAHEGGHLLQHASSYRPWRVWWALAVPAVIADLLFTFFLGCVIAFDRILFEYLAFACLAVVAAASMVSVVVEVDASRRAMTELRAQRLRDGELAQARRVLRACAATYVAETLLDLGAVFRWLPRGDGDGSVWSGWRDGGDGGGGGGGGDGGGG